jgi:hypothetical protein
MLRSCVAVALRHVQYTLKSIGLLTWLQVPIPTPKQCVTKGGKEALFKVIMHLTEAAGDHCSLRIATNTACGKTSVSFAAALTGAWPALALKNQ